jgi:hypothetical protein
VCLEAPSRDGKKVEFYTAPGFARTMTLVSLAGLVCVLGLLALSDATAAPSNPPQFGHQLIKLFAMNSTYTNLNHGSFGVVPRSVTAAMYAPQTLPAVYFL